MNSPPLTFQLLALPDLNLARSSGRSLPAPRALMTWWLAIALLTWVQLGHEIALPLPDPGWRGVVALALSITIVSSVAGRAAFEGALLLVCAGAVSITGGSGALVPLAAACAALAVALPHDPTLGGRSSLRDPSSTALPHGLTSRTWRRAIGPCLLALLGLAASNPGLLSVKDAGDTAAQAIAFLLLIGVVTLSWIHARHCQGPGGSPHAGPVCAVAMLAIGGHGLFSGDPGQAVAMLLVMAMWLPLLLAAHQPAGNPATWWFRRGANTVAACAMGCWASVSALPF